MNIWIVNQYSVPPSQTGPTRHYMLAKYLMAQGHDVTLLAGALNHWDNSQLKLIGNTEVRQEDGVRFLWLRTLPYQGNSIARIISMTMFALLLRFGIRAGKLPKPDVILGSSPHPLACLAAERLAQSLGAGFVYEIRDLWPRTLVELGRISPRHPLVMLFAAIERWLVRRSRAVVSALPGVGDYLRQTYGTDAQRKFHWIPNGVDLSEAHMQPMEAHALRKVLYAGAHGLANGLDALVDAAAILHRQHPGRFEITFIGSGPDKPALQARAAAVAPNLIFRDPVSKNKIFNILGEADTLIVNLLDSPLYTYGISLNKIFDYLAAGRPVVIGCAAANNPIAEAQAGVTVRPNDPQALAEGMLRIADMAPADRQAMGLRGRAHVEQVYGWNILGARYEKILQSASIKI